MQALLCFTLLCCVLADFVPNPHLAPATPPSSHHHTITHARRTVNIFFVDSCTEVLATSTFITAIAISATPSQRSTALTMAAVSFVGFCVRRGYLVEVYRHRKVVRLPVRVVLITF